MDRYPTPRQRPRPRPKGEYASKADRDYAAHCERRRLAGELRAWYYEKMKFRLGRGAWFTPDFVIQLPEWLEIHEVKGPHAREASIVRLKTAAALYPYLRWFRVDATWNKRSRLWIFSPPKAVEP